MLRKELRRRERRRSLQNRLLAGGTALLIALGMVAGGASPAFATHGGSNPQAFPVVSGVTITEDNGLTCGKVGYVKPDAMDKSSGTYSDVWGSVTWAVNGAFTWTLNSGYDVDFCVKGSIFVAGVDSSTFTGTSYNFSAQTGHGISHTGFRIISTPPPSLQSTGPAFTMTPQTCVDAALVGGSISLDTKSGSVTYVVTAADSTVVTNYANLLPGTYTVTPRAATGFTLDLTSYNDQAVIAAFAGPCGQLTTKPLIDPKASRIAIECAKAGSYTLDDVMIDGVRAIIWYVYVGATKPTDLSGYTAVDPSLYGTSIPVSSAQTVHVRAEAIVPNFGLERDAQTEYTFLFTEPQLCTPPPCLPNNAISYTYVNSGPTANTGIVTVAQRDGYSDKLCKPLYVTAAAWAFDVVDHVWTQTLVVANRINGGEPITQVGTYEYGALVGCGQGDIYASRTAFPNPSPLLLGPNQPAWPEGMTPWDFEETFLHDMGFSGTPGPTYLVTNPGCNALTPVTPTVSVIDECGEYGAIKLNSDNPNISYIVKDTNGIVVPVADAKEGQFTVVAIASFPYILKNYPVGGWPVNLQTKYDCELSDRLITDASIGFVDPTCNYNQKLDPSKLVVTDALLAKRESYQEFSDGRYEVVFMTTDPLARFFDSSTPVQGRTVSEGGTKLTFTGALAGPNTELCRVLPVVDPFTYLETCVTASFTLFYVEGLTYRVAINNDPSFDVVFAEGVPSKTFAVEPGDYVMAAPRANDGYILGPDQPTPLDRQFTNYGPDDCQLPELPNRPASATATNQVCSVFGMNSGTITVQFSVGPVSNPNPVRYHLAYGTAHQQELTSAVTAVPPGQYLVTAVASISTDSVNDAGNTAVLPVTVGAASVENCDLPTLAFTGASGALTGIGALALLLTLVGAGVVAARRRQA